MAGLAFECVECGGCCAGPEEGFVWVTDDEIAAMAAHLRIHEADFRRQYVRRVFRRQSLIEKANRDCIFLTDGPDGTRRCDVYPVRPTQCRTWPFWTTNLRGPEAWCEAGTRCPGINTGRLVPLDEIERRRRVTRE